ncbi:MAG: hypothetical protein L7S56_01570 [Candidatus Poseidonia sp.]|nr:hypothetical protein [Poseidonia sp.]
MAAKRSKKTTKKTKPKAKRSVIPANRYLRYVLPNNVADVNNTYYVDLANDLSAINRRLMRAGKMYHVKKITVMSAETLGGIGWTDDSEASFADFHQKNAGLMRVSICPDSWTSRGAWRRGRALHRKMEKKVLQGVSGSVQGSWADFKVYLNQGHKQGVIAVPKDLDDNNLSLGEWIYSKYVSSDDAGVNDEFTAHLLGGHDNGTGGSTYDSIGLIKSFALSRATVSTDDPSLFGAMDDDPLVNLFDSSDQTQEVLENLRAHNDDPPYDSTAYVGGTSNLPAPQVVGMTTLGSGGIGTIGGFAAMCGLLRIDTRSSTDFDNFEVVIELAAGDYRGIKATSI